MDRPSHKAWLGCVLVAAAVGFCSSASGAQSVIAYRDGDGVWRWVESDSPRLFVRKGALADETIGGMFTVTYQDLSSETGVGFDDPVSGAARRETLRAVLLYLSTVLDVPGTADLLVGSSQIDGRGPLAAGGPFLLPMTGLQGGLMFEHLTTGVDPLFGELDGVITVDFGFPWSSDPDGPSRFEYDLYTTLLHEVTHALGFFSVLGPDGRSVLLNEDDMGLFSLLDAILIRGSTEKPLVVAEGEINAFAEDVTSGDVLFAGPRAGVVFGSFPPVFAPNPFIEGSSIGHWSDATGFDVVMLPALERGEQRREYKAWELQALGDLGYDVVACGDGFVAGAEQCDDGNADDLDGCSTSCELEDVIVADAGMPDAIPDASVPDDVPDARVPDAPDADVPDDEPDDRPDAGVPSDGDPDAGAPDPTVNGDPPPTTPDPPRSPPPADDELPTASSSQSSGGCAVRDASADTADTVWPILLALILIPRRRRAALSWLRRR